MMTMIAMTMIAMTMTDDDDDDDRDDDDDDRDDDDDDDSYEYRDEEYEYYEDDDCYDDDDDDDDDDGDDDENCDPQTANTATVECPAGRIALHTVKSGDHVSHLALVYRTRVSEIVELNGLSNRSVIVIGQVLSIPCGTRAPEESIWSRAAEEA